MIAPERTISVLGIPLVRLSPRAALAEAERLYDASEPSYIAHANVHTLNLASRDDVYRRALEDAAMVLNDGKGVMLAARLQQDRFPADLNGNFFTPLLLELAAARDWPVYFLGAKPGVADRALELIVERLPRLRVVGVRDGYFDTGDGSIAAAVRSAGTGLLLVGLGNPAQELWMQANLEATGARLAVGVGAFFDFQAGQVPRAPEWMNRAGIEWVHRLAQEPRRMWRRYLLGNPRFVARVAAEEFKSRR
ncbi:MAG: WecB/TagA/CpsF family glycosyltransferase [Actinomycetota bacterium]|nr:WecB/TagA/CpsF family glycosyltransferase [Actinomycetota bacterium]